MNKAIRLITTVAASASLCVGAFASEQPTREVFSVQGQFASDGSKTITSEKTISSERLQSKTGDQREPITKSRLAISEAINEDFWFYDTSAVIAYDYDGDGYFTRVELSFDADTYYNEASVFAVLYLSRAGGDWVEYSATDVFKLYGSTPDDRYFVDTDLVSGYVPGSYDILVELYDDYDGALVASVGPEQELDLYDIPLESQNYDSPIETVIVVNDHHGGGGSTTPWMLAVLLLVAVARKLNARNRLRVTN